MASRNRRRKTPSDEVGAHLCRLIAQANEGALEIAEAEGNARSRVNPHVAALQALLEDGCSEASACLQAVMPYAWVPGPESPIAARIVVSADTLSDAHLDLATPFVGSPEPAVRRGAEQACRWLRTGSSRLRAAVHALRSTRMRTRRLGWKLLMNAGPISPALFMESVGDLPASTGLFEAFHSVAGRSHADGAAIALHWIWNTDLAIAAAALEWLERHVPVGVLRRRIAAAVPSAHGMPTMADGRVHAALEKVLDLFRTSGSAMHPSVAWELVRHGANEGAEAGFSMLCAEYERRAAHVRCGDLIAFLLEQIGARQPRVALPRSIRRAMQVVGDPTAMGVIFAALPQGAVPHRVLWSWWTCAPECPALWPLLLASTAADDEWSRRRTPVPRSTPAP
ncbi:MAG: hypothetical protein KDA22_14105, partial [Phycisphaerales bacterium]|nr:hypothetical protein [Phycisphaerales bacterium]